jgi:hypothetical protein
MRIVRNREERKVWICQDSYINRIVAKYNLEGRRYPDTPMSIDELVLYQGNAMLPKRALYQSKVGSIITLLPSYSQT